MSACLDNLGLELVLNNQVLYVNKATIYYAVCMIQIAIFLTLTNRNIIYFVRKCLL